MEEHLGRGYKNSGAPVNLVSNQWNPRLFELCPKWTWNSQNSKFQTHKSCKDALRNALDGQIARPFNGYEHNFIWKVASLDSSLKVALLPHWKFRFQFAFCCLSSVQLTANLQAAQVHNVKPTSWAFSDERLMSIDWRVPFDENVYHSPVSTIEWTSSDEHPRMNRTSTVEWAPAEEQHPKPNTTKRNTAR